METGLPLRRPGREKRRSFGEDLGDNGSLVLHFDAVRVLNGSKAFGISPEGEDGADGGAEEHIELCRQEQDNAASENTHKHYFS